ncbi:Mammalian cell entry related domain protein [Desulfovibrio sp. X2]|uniref:MlaD family protein n=1 Tax=Desulfovibrio sp. X2 TaxID=941449 RepID=UPI0003587335|nr:MlaD family protein [Desulfovibrio sp. X2]EPR44692.1 Mammalian cell entry related domain protein [Desulfovibrio sp. X2]
MEIRARYVAVGLFTLLVILAGFGYVWWKAKAQLERNTALYDIYFEAPVSGLAPASDVQFNGIKVGQVKEIAVVPDDPSKVRVRVDIRQDTPIREDSVAKLEPKGITGVTFVQILGGANHSPPLRAKPGQEVPVIPSQRSELAELVASAPEVLNRAIVLLNNLNEVLSPENRKALTQIIGNVRDVTATVANRRGEIDRTLADAGAAARNIAEVSGRMRSMADRMDVILGRAQTAFDKADTAMSAARDTFARADVFIDKDLAQAAASFRTLADDLDRAVKESSPGVAAFSNEGLANLNRLLREASALAASLERLSERVESNPQSFLFGNRLPEEPVK